MNHVKTCRDCVHARWNLTETGRISVNKSGRCAVPLPVFTLPMCVSSELTVKAIWCETQHSCPLHEHTDDKPKSITEAK